MALWLTLGYPIGDGAKPLAWPLPIAGVPCWEDIGCFEGEWPFAFSGEDCGFCEEPLLMIPWFDVEFAFINGDPLA